MKNFIIYNPTSGEINGCGVCQDGDLELQAEHVLEGIGQPNTHYVNDGEIVAYTEAQKELKANRPDHSLGWDNSTMSWLYPDSSIVLEQQKAAKWEKIKQDRLADIYSPLVFDGHTFDADKDSQALIDRYIQVATFAPSDWSVDWTLADNSTKTMTKAEIIGLGLALGVRTSTAWSRSRVLRTRIDVATNAGELVGINYFV